MELSKTSRILIFNLIVMGSVGSHYETNNGASDMED